VEALIDEPDTSDTTWEDRLENKVLIPGTKTGLAFKLWIGGLLLVLLIGVVAYVNQYNNGLYVTGMRDRISWGIYIAAFVFFAGISMAGTLMSAILRITKATWRTPVTRFAEAITVMGLVTAGLFVIVDMGQPTRLYQMYLNGNWQSPLMWDMMAITVYLTSSVVYLLIPMIPDLAFFRDGLPGRVPRAQSWMYGTLSFGWIENPPQRRALAKAVAILTILIIPVAVTVHTVLSFVFSTTVRVSWNSTSFGFFFVAGAIFSGVAVLIIVFAVVRRRYHLEEYITERQFTYLGYLMAAMSMILIYTNATEFITKGFKASDDDLFAFRELFATKFAPLFWFYFFGGLVLPVLIVAFKRTRTITGLVVASSFAVVAMFVERYFIVVAGMSVPLMPYEPSTYAPTATEWAIVAGGFALFLLFLTVFTRLFPILAVWEMKHEHHERKEVTA